MGLVERIADPNDSLRAYLRAALKWGVPPTVFLRERTVAGPWTDQDTEYVMALEAYEARLCPRGHDTTVSMAKEHTWDWRAPTIGACHACWAQDVEAKRWDDHDHRDVMLYGAAHLADDCEFCVPPE